jgi:hypothetical protein
LYRKMMHKIETRLACFCLVVPLSRGVTVDFSVRDLAR